MSSFIRSSIDRYECISFSELQNKGVTVPECQRLLTEEHVNTIYDNYIDTLDKGKEPIFLGALAVCTDSKTGTNWLIDGNHRYHAIKKLYENRGYNMKLVCQIIEVSGVTDVEGLFNKSNNSIGVTQLPAGVSLGQTNLTVKKMQMQYPLLIKSGGSGTVHRPHIHINDLQNKIGEAMKYVTIIPDEFMIKVIDYNYTLKCMARSKFKRNSSDTLTKIENLCNEAHNKGGLLVGLLPTTYNWVLAMYGIAVPKPEEKTQRVAIPPELRQDVWHKFKKASKYSEHIIVECKWCNDELSFNSMVCDHFPKSVKNGGTNSIDNLVPSCVKCNSARGCNDDDVKK